MKYSGMTVNERLYHAGFINAFYEAVDKKDRNTAIEILQKVEVDENSINDILKKFTL